MKGYKNKLVWRKRHSNTVYHHLHNDISLCSNYIFQSIKHRYVWYDIQPNLLRFRHYWKFVYLIHEPADNGHFGCGELLPERLLLGLRRRRWGRVLPGSSKLKKYQIHVLILELLKIKFRSYAVTDIETLLYIAYYSKFCLPILKRT